MSEWLMIPTMAVSGALFAAGGTHIEGIGGQKWLRRYLLPCFLAFICVLSGVKIWVGVVYGLILIPALSAGYGSRTAYCLKVLVFTCYGIPSLLIGFSWWVVICPALLAALFAASNWKPLATTVFWKSWEFLAGVLVSLCLIGAILNKWGLA